MNMNIVGWLVCIIGGIFGIGLVGGTALGMIRWSSGKSTENAVIIFHYMSKKDSSFKGMLKLGLKKLKRVVVYKNRWQGQQNVKRLPCLYKKNI